MNSPNIIKLINGETIMAEIIDRDEGFLNIVDPVQLEITESEATGKPMLVALTWIPLMEKLNLITLKNDHVVAIAKVDRDIELYYKKSLAILKNDAEALKTLIEEEEYEDSIEALEDIEQLTTPTVQANTVH